MPLCMLYVLWWPFASSLSSFRTCLSLISTFIRSIFCFSVFIIPQREILAIMVFLAITIAYMMRACLPFAMLTMVLPGNNKYPPMPPIRPIPPPGPIPPPPPPPPLFLYLDYFLVKERKSRFLLSNNIFFHENQKAVHLYNWEPSTQGLILGSFYIGYVIMLVPGTFLVEKFGGKYSLLFSMLANTLVAALFPVAIDEGQSQSCSYSI